MQISMLSARRLAAALVTLLCITAASAFAQTTAFSFQGRLTDNNAAASGTFEMRFMLFDALTGGTQQPQPTPITLDFTVAGSNPVTVANGIFTVPLDFGADAFPGANRYLEISVRHDGTESFITLNPRQEVKSAPHAIQSKAATVAPATYRWATFHTYDNATGSWAFANDPSFFGGVQPSLWTDGNALASQISPNKDLQRTLFQRKGYAKENALIFSDVFLTYSSTDGQVVAVLFRIKNTTGSAINWTPFFHYTAYLTWSETASATLNGANSWSSGTSGSTSVTFSIPSGQVSTVIFVATSGLSLNIISGPIYQRHTRLAFYNNSLNLPAGLQFVDDLDTATGGWSN